MGVLTNRCQVLVGPRPPVKGHAHTSGSALRGGSPHALGRTGVAVAGWGSKEVPLRLGIDFGTTRTVVAYCDRGIPVVSFSNAGGDAEESFPSVVAERRGELIFGFDAERVASHPEWTTFRSFKRLLNDPSPEATLQVGSTELRIVDLLARFSALRTALVARSNLTPLLGKTEPLQAFVAAPANAHSTQRFPCLDAFRRAGFDVLGLLNEPSAAGFEYTHRSQHAHRQQRSMLVYDIGGGTSTPRSCA